MSIDAMKQALEALETLNSGDTYKTHNAATALRAAIEQAEIERATQEIWQDVPGAVNFGITPQREWQSVTENEIKHLWYEACQTNLELTSQLIVHLARNIEAKLKEKNHD